MVGPTAFTVWQYNATTQCGAGNDYPDVPARPFLVGDLANPTVLWFAGNSNGNYASIGTGGVDILATLQRGSLAGPPKCLPWSTPPTYANSTPQSYSTGLWMVAPFTPDGINVQALVHNEFHGEWVGNNSFCSPPKGVPPIYLPCNYWNMVSASSTDGGQTFQVAKQPGNPGFNSPAIALGAPYQDPTQGTQPNPNFLGPQGMAAQSNILQFGSYYYVLAQQLPYSATGPYSPQGGVCIYRAPVPASPGGALVWTGWGGSTYDVPVPTTYPDPTNNPTLCNAVLGSQFRFSWSISRSLQGFVPVVILIGQDTQAGMARSGVALDNCPYAPEVTSGSTDGAFVYALATLDPNTGTLTQFWHETCLLQTNSIAKWQSGTTFTGQAYPSLLDPASPGLGAGDRNFQYSGIGPYLYFTQLNARTGTGPFNNRNLVRMPMEASWGNPQESTSGASKP